MTGAGQEYCDGVLRSFGFFATWLPNQPLKLGDVGVLTRSAFRHETTLQELDISFDVLVGSTAVDINLASKEGTAVDFTAGGTGSQAGAEAKVGARVQFAREGAFILRALGCRERHIRDKPLLATAIATALREGRWKTEWIVVDRLMVAESATVLVSNSADCSVDISGDAALSPGPFDIADARLGLRVARQSGDLFACVAATTLSLLFQASKVRKRWFRMPSIESVRDSTRPSTEPQARDVIEPAYTEEVGTVIHHFPKASVAVVELATELKLKEVVQFRSADGVVDFEQVVDSMEVDHQQVRTGKKRQTIAVRVFEPVRPGVRVFRPGATDQVSRSVERES
jgi:hypothetical protein